MSHEINAAFLRIDQILPFLHILSAVCFITTQVVFISCTRCFIKSHSENYLMVLTFCKKYIVLFSLFFMILAISGFLISQSGDFKFSDPMIEGIITTKYSLLGFILLNFLYISYRLMLIKKNIEADELDEIEDSLIIVSMYFTSLNVVLSTIAIFLGVVIVEFR